MTAASFDTGVLLLVNHGTANVFFDALMPILSDHGYLLVLPFFLFLAVKTFTEQGPRRPSVSFLLSLFLISCAAVLLAALTENLLKHAIGRVRPCTAIDGIRLITACPRSFSMPSGHAISSFAFAAPLYYLSRPYANRIVRAYPLLLAVCIAFSRVYLGVHYPSDIIIGGLLGAAIGLLLVLVLEWIVTRVKKTRGEA